MTTKYIFDWDNKNQMALVTSENLDTLREELSIEDKQASIMRYRTGRKWLPVRKYMITPNGRFKINLFQIIIQHLKKSDIPFQAILTEKFKEKLKPAFIQNPDHDIIALDLSPRYYQEQCVQNCLLQGNGIVKVATAGGKTLIMALLIHNINCLKKQKTLIITIPSLVSQTYNDFKDYGLLKHYSISKWDGSNSFSNCDIVIASNTILMSKKQDLSVLGDFDSLVVDECHKLRRGNAINKVLKKIKTIHKFGFTGTLPEDADDVWNIIGQLGPIIYEKTSTELKDMGYIAPAQAIILKPKYKNTNNIYSIETPSIDNPTKMYNEECEFIYKNDFRNDIINKLCTNVDKNTLVLVDRIEYQQTLVNLLKQKTTSKNIQYVRGDVPKEDREKIKKIMEHDNNVICIAMSSIFSTGINIKNIHYIIFTMPGKAKIRLLQSIGRGLRLNENKNKLIIFDIADQLLYGVKHLQQRIQLYEEEKIKYVEKEIEES